MIQQSHSWGIYSDKTTIQKDMWTPVFTATLFTVSKTWKQPKCFSTDEWIKMWNNGILLSPKKEWNNVICRSMEGTRDYHTKTNTIWYCLYVESKIWHKWIYLLNRHTENRLVVAKGGGSGGGKDWVLGITRYKLVYIGWINKLLLYSTGNYIKYPVINDKGKKSEKLYIYKYIIESLCYTVEINTTL